VYDPVTDAQYAGPSIAGAKPGTESFEGCASIANLGPQIFFNEDLTRRIFGGELGRRSDAFDLTARFEVPMLSRRPVKYTKLEAR
jgi:hypothetical protein